MHCSLQEPGNNKWSSKAVEAFNKLANDEDNTFDLKILSDQQDTPFLVELYVNGESVAEQLVLVSGLISEKQSDETTVPSETKALCNETITDISPDKETYYDKSPTQVLSDFPDELDDKEFVPESVLSSDEVTKTSVLEVKISHFNDTDDFFVQSLDDKDQLSTITQDLSKTESIEAVLDVDDMVAAKINSNQLWYRAKILDTNSSGSTVFLVDIGCTDVASNLKKIPKDLAEKKPLAKHCSLKSPRGVWTAVTKEKLSTLAKVGDRTFEMKIINEGEPCEIDLFVDGQSLIDTFVSDEMSELNNDIKNMILDLVETKIPGSLQNDIKDINAKQICNIEGTESNTVVSDEMSNYLNDEIQNTSFESVEKELSSSLQNVLKDITEQPICNIEDAENKGKEMEVQQIADDLIPEAQDKNIDDNKIALEDSKQIDDDSKLHQEDTQEPEDSDDTSPKEEIAVDVISCSQEKIIENEVKENAETSNCVTKSSAVDDNIVAVTSKQTDDDSKPGQSPKNSGYTSQGKIIKNDVEEIAETSNCVTKSSAVDDNIIADTDSKSWQEDAEVPEDSCHTSQDKIIETEFKEMEETTNTIVKSSVLDDIAVTNEQTGGDSISLKEGVQVPENSGDTSFKTETDPNAHCCSSNGHTNEGENSEIIVKSSSKMQSESENLSKHSPTTNRRMNFDEQIVPGCISIVKTEDSPNNHL